MQTSMQTVSRRARQLSPHSSTAELNFLALPSSASQAIPPEEATFRNCIKYTTHCRVALEKMISSHPSVYRPADESFRNGILRV